MACRKMYLGLKERPCLASKLALSAFLSDGMLIVIDTLNACVFYGLQDKYFFFKGRQSHLYFLDYFPY
jgi:hypothetical protein